MDMSKNNQIIASLSIFLAVFFVFDLLFHFILVPFDQLTFSVMNLKGDIDFTNIGFFNLFLRGVSLFGIIFHAQYRRYYYGVGLFLIAVTTTYLMVDSLWVFWNYLSLYGYWFLTLMITILLMIRVFNPSLLPSLQTWLFYGSWISMVIIALVYIDIMGLNWPREFVYAYFQRIFFEGLYFVVGYYVLKKD